MSHRLGSLNPLTPATVIGPGSTNFSPPAAPGGTKFLILHFTSATFAAGDRLEVNLGYGTDIFTAASGPDFWSRPIKGNSVTINFIDGGSGTGQVLLSEFGRGEGLQNGGQTNTNADLFLIDSHYMDPTFFNSNGVCPGGTGPSWENVAVLPPGVMRDTARSVGMFVEASEGKLSSCSAALIGPDLILTAAHCVSSGTEIPSGSFTLDYQTDNAGNRPAGYDPKFHKLKAIIKTGWQKSMTGPGLIWGSGLDYAIVQIETPPGGLGVPPLSIRSTVLTMNEELFVIHHPRGVVKKISRQPTDSTCKVLGSSGGVVTYACDSDNGSSGSPVFDATGKIVAVNDWAPGACGNQGQAATAILQDFLTATPPPKDVDVVLVFDRSGSMSLPGLSGATKIQEARRAAALFIDLLRTDQTHRVGLVTFSTNASTTADPDFFTLAAANDANKNTLIGPPPARDSGKIGVITPGGSTTIGGGLRAGQMQLPAPSPGANTPAILLMTDGLQNTLPMIEEVEGTGELGSTRLCIIGFGSEANLDGPLLTNLARRHGGIYTRAGEGLELKKFFVLAFGNIFHTAIAMDPFFIMPVGETSAKPLPLNVCGEESMTVVLSWEHAAENLILSLETPAGNTITSSTPGVVASSGNTWVYFRMQLPFSSERDGTWQVNVTRLRGGGEFPAPLGEERYFVTAIVDGGPYFHPIAPLRYYTGDTINPLVVLREPSGFRVEANVTVDIQMPGDGTGNILTKSGLRQGNEVDGDQLDARSGTLIALEQEGGRPLISTTTQQFSLFDDGELNGRGTLEPDGVFGNPLKDIVRFEGNYTFHAKAVYGSDGCTGTRETLWSVNISVGIDPGKTTVDTKSLGTLPDGRQHVIITFTPRDRYGNNVGPGRLGTFETHAQFGCELIGGLNDVGDGSYTQEVACDPTSTLPPGLIVTQPERPPVVIAPPTPAEGEKKNCIFWLLVAAVFFLLLIVVLLLIWIFVGS